MGMHIRGTVLFQSVAVVAARLRLMSIAGVIAIGAGPMILAQALAGEMPAGDKLPGKDPTNAALRYYRPWTDPAFNTLSDAVGAATQLDSDLTKLLTDHKDVVEQILLATKLETADFGIEWSQGIKARLPHLSKLRASARILLMDARRCLACGDRDGAAERVASAYVISRHCAHDGLLISSLVGIAVDALANSRIEELFAANALTEGGKQQILSQARRLATADGFGTREAVRREMAWMSMWLKTLYQGKGAGAGQAVADELVPAFGLDGEKDKDARAALASADERAMNEALAQSERMYADVLACWDQPDAAQRIDSLTTDLESGKYGLIPKAICPALGKARISDQRARESHDSMLKKLENWTPSR